MSQTIVVIGAGQAGGQLVASLRGEGFEGEIVLVGDEPYVPYQRPPLSKKFLAGEVDISRVYFKPPEFYEQAGVKLLLGRRATALDRAGKTVTLDDGTALDYGKLVLATGSKVRILSLPGADLPGIFYLRGIDDMRAIQEQLVAGKKLVIVGGGYIGLEVASVATEKGLAVTVLEMAERLMQRVVGTTISEYYTERHRREGVAIRTGMQVSEFAGDGRVRQVLCSDGSRFEADAVIVGVGILPDTELAAAAGLAVDDGIVVDEYTRSSDPDILAIGDCCNHPSALLGRRLRLESVPNALGQARTAAATLCGKQKAYNEAPWFWSDQYDLKLQIVGLIEGHEQTVLRGDPAGGSFMVFYLKGGAVIAVEAVNSRPEFMLCKQLVARKVRIAPERLGDTAVALKELAASG